MLFVINLIKSVIIILYIIKIIVLNINQRLYIIKIVILSKNQGLHIINIILLNKK